MIEVDMKSILRCSWHQHETWKGSAKLCTMHTINAKLMTQIPSPVCKLARVYQSVPRRSFWTPRRNVARSYTPLQSASRIQIISARAGRSSPLFCSVSLLCRNDDRPDIVMMDESFVISEYTLLLGSSITCFLLVSLRSCLRAFCVSFSERAFSSMRLYHRS